MEGILLIDKPKEWTSHDVCAFVRGRFRVKKVGHAGTLDPHATGLLVLLLGKATKLSAGLSGSDKDYEGIIRLGIDTDSQDMQGKVLAEKDASSITLEAVQELAKGFVGPQTQIPPMVSAIKKDGVKLYQLARKGKTIEREPRDINIYELNIFSKENDDITFNCSVSKGTYVRTLAHDIGRKLDNFGTLAELRRTRSGSYHVKDSIEIEALKKLTPEEVSERVIPLADLISSVSS